MCHSLSFVGTPVAGSIISSIKFMYLSVSQEKMSSSSSVGRAGAGADEEPDELAAREAFGAVEGGGVVSSNVIMLMSLSSDMSTRSSQPPM